MEFSKNELDILKKCGINFIALSKNEKITAKKILDSYFKHIEEYDVLSHQISSLKFNKVTLSESTGISRMGLHKNPTYAHLIDFLISKANKHTTNLNTLDTVSREKYDLLKTENKEIIKNIVDQQKLLAEIDFLKRKLDSYEKKNTQTIYKIDE